MEPSEKAPVIAEMLEKMTGRSSAILNSRCIDPPIGCGASHLQFRNELSLREYQISGFCQKCQDRIFGDGTDV